MTRGFMIRLSILLVAGMALLALLVGLRLPADAQLPVHWNLAGEPDRFEGKWFALFMPVAITAGTASLLAFLPALEPRRQGLQRSEGLYLWTWAGALLVLASAHAAILLFALGREVSVPHLIVGAVGIMFMLIGNQLGKSRSMLLVGIRTPWTLSSEEVWIKTHRLSGKLLMAGGLLLFIAALLGVSPLMLGILLGLVLIVGLIGPAIYSYLLWRREGDQPSQ
jgi:uncharacterized membrane protein